MFCNNCGKQISDNNVFCDGCGARVEQQTAPTQIPNQVNYNQANYSQENNAPVMTVGQYIGMFLLSIIPIVGFVLLLVWAFGSNVNPNKKNYCRATLIVALIGVVFTIIASIFFGFAVAELGSLDGIETWANEFGGYV